MKVNGSTTPPDTAHSNADADGVSSLLGGPHLRCASGPWHDFVRDAAAESYVCKNGDCKRVVGCRMLDNATHDERVALLGFF